MKDAEPIAQKPDPRLSIPEQIKRLREKGVSFDLCSEEEAAAYLLEANNYLRVTSYRVLYRRGSNGSGKGTYYIDLDFGDLVILSSLDRQLRTCFREITVDVEHFAKMKVLRLVEEKGEDGHAIVRDFYTSMNHRGRNALLGSMARRSRNDNGRDTYAGDPIEHHLADMPVWVLLEVIDFGTFVAFYLFCAQRWGCADMQQEHYILKSVKALRNAASHNHCIINGVAQNAGSSGHATNGLITESLNAAGMPRTKSRRAKLSNPRIAQMAAALWCMDAFCTRQSTKRRSAGRLECLRESYEAAYPRLQHNSTIVSFFEFLWKLVDIWLPTGV